jgi:hypothetical protein
MSITFALSDLVLTFEVAYCAGKDRRKLAVPHFRVRKEFWPSVIPGLPGYIVFGIGMQMMTAPTPDGSRVPIIILAAQIVRSDFSVIG